MKRTIMPWKLARLTPYMKPDTGAEGGGSGTEGKEGKEGTEGTSGDDSNDDDDDGDEDKKYTDKDVDDIVNKKFAKWKNKYEKEQAEKLSEAEKLANMNKEQKAEHEKKKAEQKVADLERQIAGINMTKEARKMLADKNVNLNDDLVSVLVDSENDAEKTKENVDAFVEMYNAAIDEEVKKRLAGKSPKTGSGKTITKEEIMKIPDVFERQKMMTEHKELFI